MKKLAVVLMLLILLQYGCKGCEQGIKRLESSTIGLDRVVTVYDCSGQPIKQWKGRINVALSQSGYARIVVDDKVILVSGTVIIEEVD